jgi:hypothetical protein
LEPNNNGGFESKEPITTQVAKIDSAAATTASVQVGQNH